jgi:hypothetical protein
VNGTLRTTFALAAIAAFLPAPASALAGQQNGAPPARHQTNAASAGTPGRIAKFTTGGKVVDSNITEDAGGKIGVGTTAPTSPLTVNGVVETTGAGGGVKFPDGSVQTTAGLPGVAHDTTLAGDGTAALPLGVVFPLRIRGTYLGPVIDIFKTGPRESIRIISGSENGQQNGAPGISVGGGSGEVTGGVGVSAGGGYAQNGSGGDGVRGFGGFVSTGIGGVGVAGYGGDGNGAPDGSQGAVGGSGVYAVGGASSGVGRRAGTGIEVDGGFGINGATRGYAGVFRGDVQVYGTLAKSGGSFKIDHPLDPENKTLSHSFVESPDMMNIYNGNVELDASGEAVVELPDWFGALNRDYRYQLTAVGAPGPNLYVAEKVANNRFRIAGGTAGMEVSWQVTGIRQDAWANAHRIPVVEDKPEVERGSYLTPDAFGQPEERGVEWARDPETMRKRKEVRLAAKSAEQSPE